MKYFKLNVHRFPDVKFEVFIYQNRRAMRKGIDSKYPCGKHIEKNSKTEALAHFCNCREKTVGLFFNVDDFTPGNVAHEAQHVMLTLFGKSFKNRRYAVKIHNAEKEEAICTVTGDFVDAIYKGYND